MLSSLRRFARSEVAQERLRIIQFYKQYGEKATEEAFGADRKVINRWGQRLRRHNGGLEGLIPESTRPRRTRAMTVPVAIIQFIREIRQEHPRLGKEKIKPLLDEYCQDRGLRSISESTIGKVIKRHKLFYQKAGRIYHDPSRKQPQQQKRLRVKRSPRHEDFGHIIADTVERVTDGVKDYFYNAIDAKLKFALSLNYKRLNSKNMKDFYNRFRALYPLQIKDWQSDNGAENLGEFDKGPRHWEKSGETPLPWPLLTSTLATSAEWTSSVRSRWFRLPRRSLSLLRWTKTTSGRAFFGKG